MPKTLTKLLKLPTVKERVILRPTAFQGASARYLATCRSELISIRQSIYHLSQKAQILEREIARVESDKERTSANTNL